MSFFLVFNFRFPLQRRGQVGAASRLLRRTLRGLGPAQPHRGAVATSGPEKASESDRFVLWHRGVGDVCGLILLIFFSIFSHCSHRSEGLQGPQPVDGVLLYQVQPERSTVGGLQE